MISSLHGPISPTVAAISEHETLQFFAMHLELRVCRLLMLCLPVLWGKDVFLISQDICASVLARAEPPRGAARAAGQHLCAALHRGRIPRPREDRLARRGRAQNPGRGRRAPHADVRAARGGGVRAGPHRGAMRAADRVAHAHTRDSRAAVQDVSNRAGAERGKRAGAAGKAVLGCGGTCECASLAGAQL